MHFPHNCAATFEEAAGSEDAFPKMTHLPSPTLQKSLKIRIQRDLFVYIKKECKFGSTILSGDLRTHIHSEPCFP
jgi:hypothetical protein